MKFNMTKPCEMCPFRTDRPFHLSRQRAMEFARSLLSGETFICHKTGKTIEDDDSDSDGAIVPKSDGSSEHCAGAMIFLEAQNSPNQLMRIAERLGRYDYRRLDMNQPVAKSTREFIKCQETPTFKAKP